MKSDETGFGNWLKVELDALEQERKDQWAENRNTWRLQLAGQAMSGFILNHDHTALLKAGCSQRDADERIVKACLRLADKLIAEHEKTKYV